MTDEIKKEEQQPDQAFWDIADGFIALANQGIDQADAGRVAEALMYAAARFNVFVAAASSESKDDFCEDRSEIFKFLAGEFRNMLDESLDDYQEHYKDYTED